MTSRLGATLIGDGTRFEVWAPVAERSVAVELVDRGERHPLAPAADGCWGGDVAGVHRGDRYRFVIDDGAALPDPASRWQPDGVHGPSAVADPQRFEWHDDGWRGRGLEGSVIYELHVGTFTPAGTFDAAAAELARLVELGVTSVELMPVNAFPGQRNWGYDGVFPFAVQQSYGGPEALAQFVDAAHANGLAVLLDVVYNHVGPEGNVLSRFAPYFSDAYRTAWGPALNVAGPGSDGVRRYVVENVAGWVRDFHVDGFRFDAVHAVVDPTANPFWEEVSRAARDAAAAAHRRITLIGESSDNDPRQVHPPERNGFGFDAVSCDDVHHTLRVAVTGDRSGYYADYAGTAAELADTIAHRWHFRGQRSIARGRRHGRPVDDVAPHRFVACTQNHDQVGNRPHGERPDHHVTSAQRRLLPAAVLLSPYTPMLFMGEEYGERRPFPFFVDHSDPNVVRATNAGRRAELSNAAWTSGFPEPGDPATFESAVIDPTVVDRDVTAAALIAMYTELLRIRRDVPPVASPQARQRVTVEGAAVIVRRTLDTATSILIVNLSAEPASVAITGAVVFASDERTWGGDGFTRLADGRLDVAPWTVALAVDYDELR